MNTKSKINTISILMLLLVFVTPAMAKEAYKSLISKKNIILGEGSISGHVTVSRSDLSNLGAYNYQQVDVLLLTNGSSCDDNNPLTTDDKVYDKCICRGSLINETVDTKPETYQVFPNPVAHALYINDPSYTISDVKIYNVLGEAVNIHFETLSLGLQLDVSSLKP